MKWKLEKPLLNSFFEHSPVLQFHNLPIGRFTINKISTRVYKSDAFLLCLTKNRNMFWEGWVIE